MKILQLIPYRECDRRFRLKKYYIVQVEESNNGDLILPIPSDIIRAYHVEMGDIAIFKIVDKDRFIIRFARKTMCGFVQKIKD